MLSYVARRCLYMIPTLFGISVVAFAIIQLPPGDYLTTLVSRLENQGESVDRAQLESLRERYGLGDPLASQYVTWMSSILFHGDFGQSFEYSRPVADLVADRLPLTVVLAVTTLLTTWLLAFPIGLYSAVRQYSPGDYLATIVGFLGLAIPNFMIALLLMYLGQTVFGMSVGGLFSPEFEDAAWNLGKVIDLLGHLWVPVLVLATAGTAGLIRVLRANLLDELHRPYVVAARARGMPERKLLVRYPLRAALNPFVSTVGYVLPALVSGEVVVAQVLSLPTTGPLLLNALRSQDMYLASSVILIVSVLTVIGTLLSDVLLAWLDPRVRLDQG
ncbi:ABC transporter permease [Streptomyces radicis]|uniref:ABC transporter permease n=1 Tax=Streptomyces radicis TaxID=1750517 RepID=A0A3A9WFY5_9ACTN|nr:ABC transporter permease [Streptomyces radicis]RKN08334.1 ABC transporter permease [Streptomyces radicis]RKN21630.1 ABC transporter permease [Streptomyces radicis]